MILFLSVEELKKKMKKNKNFLPNDEIFVPRMLKRKLIFLLLLKQLCRFDKVTGSVFEIFL